MENSDGVCKILTNCSRDYKTLFMLISTDKEFIKSIHVEMLTIVDILTFISMIRTYQSLKARKRGDRAAYQLQIYVSFRCCGVAVAFFVLCGSRGRVGVRTPPPEKSQNIGFLSNIYWSGSPKKAKSYRAGIQCWAIISTPAKRHLNGISLAGR